MTAEGNTNGLFRPALAIGGGGVEIVYPVGQGEIHHPVDFLLVNHVFRRIFG